MTKARWSVLAIGARPSNSQRHGGGAVNRRQDVRLAPSERRALARPVWPQRDAKALKGVGCSPVSGTGGEGTGGGGPSSQAAKRKGKDCCNLVLESIDLAQAEHTLAFLEQALKLDARREILLSGSRRTAPLHVLSKGPVAWEVPVRRAGVGGIQQRRRH